MPGICSESACESGNAPLAMSVVTTGMRVASASSFSSLSAPALMTPPPTYSTGLRARAIASAASWICSGWPLAVGR